VISNFFFYYYLKILVSVQIPLQSRALPSRQTIAASDIIDRTEVTNYLLTRQATRNSSRIDIKRKFFLLFTA